MYMKKAAMILTVILLLCALFAFCGSAADGTTDTTGASGAAAETCEHDFGAWEDVTPATCTTTGTHKHTCTKCGYVETQPTNTLSHEYNTEYTVDTPATCTKAGSESQHCKRCGAQKPNSSRTVAAKGHSFGNWQTVTAATCTTGGTETRTCSVCSEKETRFTDALGHDKVTVPAKAATCTENGESESIRCKRCNAVFQEAIVVSALGHDMVDDPAKEPTCTEDGATAGRHCSRCDYVVTKQQVIPKLGHKTVIDPASASTCTVHGKTQGSHCEVCGTVFYAQNELPLLPHDYEESVVVKTCISDGYHQYTCRKCGDYYRDNIDYALGHVIVVEKAIEETCTTDGLSVRTYCSVCGEVLEDSHVIPARGHRWTDNVTKATRKADGKIVTVCADCGVKQGETVIARIDSITLSQTKYYCDGKKKTPTITITDTEGKKLVYKKDFTTSWDSGRKKPGVYYVTVSFIGKYAGAKTLRFKILLHKTVGVKITAGKGSAKVTWNGTPGAKKYYVYVCETKNGKYKKAGVTTKTALNVKKLTSGKTYYFIVRAAATDPAGNLVKGPNSPIRKAKIL